MLSRCWRDHSLTIVAGVIGTAFLATGIPFREGTWFDVATELGGTFWGIAGLGFLSWLWRERAKPDE